MTQAEIAAGTVVGGEFRVVRSLHTGAFASVFEAVHVASGAKRALKVVTGAIGKDARFREVFLEEARRVAALKSERIASVFERGIDSTLDAPFGAMELCLPRWKDASDASGEPMTLSACVEQGLATAAPGDPAARVGSLRPLEALAILEQLAEALATAHDAQLTHRDLKPEAVLLVDPASPNPPTYPSVKVLFLGAAKLASQAKRNTTAAMSRPLWMAPEQAETDAVATPATDVWALGLIAYWILTGKFFWRAGRDAGSAMMTLMREVLYDPVPLASVRAREQDVATRLPPEFDAWFARAVARDRQQRFQHARDAMQILRSCFQATIDAERAAAARAPAPARAITAIAGTPASLSAGGALLSAQPSSAAPAARAQIASTWIDPAAGPVAPQVPPTRAPSVASPPSPNAAKIKQRMPRKRLAAILTAAFVSLTALVGGLVYWFFIRDDAANHSEARRHASSDDDDKKKKKQAEPQWSDAGCPIPVTSRDPIWGDRSAPVTLVVFSDLGCERCRSFEKTLAALKREYGPQRMRVVWKTAGATQPEPGDPRVDFTKQPAMQVAAAGEAVFELAGNDAFWKFHDAALAQTGTLDLSSLEAMAVDAGVDRDAFARRRLDEAVSRQVTEDVELSVRAGVLDVPTAFVNGKPVEAFAPVAKIESMIDAAEGEAKTERAGGTPADRVYVTLATRNYTAPKPGAAEKPPPILFDVDKTIYRVPVDDSPMRGPRAAMITIVEFGDFECPFTRQVEATLAKLQAEHDEDVRLVWKDNPLPSHKRAEAAAELARFVRSDLGDDAFWRVRTQLFKGSVELDESELRVDAEIAGADGDQAIAAVTGAKFKSGIAKDQDLAADLGESATPTFYINGRRLRGAHSLEQFEAVIAEETIRAKKAIADGTPLDDLYDKLIRDGKAPAAFETKSPGAIPKGTPSRGAKKPKVTIVEFADFQCETCRKAEAALDELMKTEGERVQIVWRNRPVAGHPEAELAAEAALEAKAQLGNEGFWKYHDKLFAAQGTTDGFDRAHLEQYASEVGCDLAKFKDALDSHKHKDAVELDRKAADDLGLSEMPSFIVGTFLVAGDQPLARFKRAVDKALAEAK